MITQAVAAQGETVLHLEEMARLVAVRNVRYLV